jgi:hypothetical protein
MSRLGKQGGQLDISRACAVREVKDRSGKHFILLFFALLYQSRVNILAKMISYSTGGSATAHGDSGVPLRVVLKSSGESCI